jgi:cell division transport system ATP-binding protein
LRRRVIELSHGKIVRDELGGQYAPRDLTTAEFGALLREPAPAPQRFDRPSADLFDDAFTDED